MLHLRPELVDRKEMLKSLHVVSKSEVKFMRFSGLDRNVLVVFGIHELTRICNPDFVITPGCPLSPNLNESFFTLNVDLLRLRKSFHLAFPWGANVPYYLVEKADDIILFAKKPPLGEELPTLVSMNLARGGFLAADAHQFKRDVADMIKAHHAFDSIFAPLKRSAVH